MHKLFQVVCTLTSKGTGSTGVQKDAAANPNMGFTPALVSFKFEKWET